MTIKYAVKKIVDEAIKKAIKNEIDGSNMKVCIRANDKIEYFQTTFKADDIKKEFGPCAVLTMQKLIKSQSRRIFITLLGWCNETEHKELLAYKEFLLDHNAFVDEDIYQRLIEYGKTHAANAYTCMIRSEMFRLLNYIKCTEEYEKLIKDVETMYANYIIQNYDFEHFTISNENAAGITLKWESRV